MPYLNRVCDRKEAWNTYRFGKSIGIRFRLWFYEPQKPDRDDILRRFRSRKLFQSKIGAFHLYPHTRCRSAFLRKVEAALL